MYFCLTKANFKNLENNEHDNAHCNEGLLKSYGDSYYFQLKKLFLRPKIVVLGHFQNSVGFLPIKRNKDEVNNLQ